MVEPELAKLPAITAGNASDQGCTASHHQQAPRRYYTLCGFGVFDARHTLLPVRENRFFAEGTIDNCQCVVRSVDAIALITRALLQDACLRQLRDRVDGSKCILAVLDRLGDWDRILGRRRRDDAVMGIVRGW
jgi:hypothetical protein